MYDFLLRTLLAGAGATAIMDLWALTLRIVFGIHSLDYALVGRWLLWMHKGRFRHRTIARTPAARGEKPTGWAAHYLIGIAFAVIPSLLAGKNWLVTPDFVTAWFSGVISLSAPFFILQPAFGFGIAAAETPFPARARLFSFLAHSAYGVGLFISAASINLLLR